MASTMKNFLSYVLKVLTQTKSAEWQSLYWNMMMMLTSMIMSRMLTIFTDDGGAWKMRQMFNVGTFPYGALRYVTSQFK